MNHKECIRCFEVKPIHVFEKKKVTLVYKHVIRFQQCFRFVDLLFLFSLRRWMALR